MNFLFVVVIRNNLHKVADCGRKIIRYAKIFVPNNGNFLYYVQYKYILNTFKKCSFTSLTLKLYHFHVTIDFGIAFGTLYSEPPFLLVHAKSADSTPFLLLLYIVLLYSQVLL